MSLKTMLIILDGLGDRCHDELDGKTPLEFAHTPILDELAKKSETGMMYTLEPGYCLNTDLAHLILFGYEEREYPGRAVIDLLGEEVEIGSENLVLRTSWGSVHGQGPFLIKERFVSQLSKEEAVALGESLSGDFEEKFFQWSFSHDSHGFLVVKGDGLSAFVSDSDPFYKDQWVMEVEPFDETIEAEKTANLLNTYLKKAHKVLKEHWVNQRRQEIGLEEANMLLVKWAGKWKEVESFQLRTGLHGKLIAGSKLLKGLARYIHLDFEMEKDFVKGLESALRSDYDFICLHTKDTDEAAHTKNPLAKVEVLERIDKTLRPILELDQEKWLVVITSDHSTPSSGELIHSGEYVPVLFYGKNTRPDSVEQFAERACIKGTHRLKGRDLIPLILNYSDRSNLYHLRHGKKHRLYKPTQVNPLK